MGTTGTAITLPLAPMSKIQCLKILHICANSLLKQMLITRFVGASTTALPAASQKVRRPRGGKFGVAKSAQRQFYWVLIFNECHKS